LDPLSRQQKLWHGHHRLTAFSLLQITLEQLLLTLTWPLLLMVAFEVLTRILVNLTSGGS